MSITTLIFRVGKMKTKMVFLFLCKRKVIHCGLTFWKQVFAKWHMEDSSEQTPLNQMSRFGKGEERTQLWLFSMPHIAQLLKGIISLTLKLLHCLIIQHHSKYFVIFLSDSYELMGQHPKLFIAT